MNRSSGNCLYQGEPGIRLTIWIGILREIGVGDNTCKDRVPWQQMSEKLHLEELRWLAWWYMGGNMVGWGLVFHIQWSRSFFLPSASVCLWWGRLLVREAPSLEDSIYICLKCWFSYTKWGILTLWLCCLFFEE